MALSTAQMLKNVLETLPRLSVTLLLVSVRHGALAGIARDFRQNRSEASLIEIERS